MKPLRRYLISALLLCLLAGCNIGDATVYPNTDVPDIPEKTTIGADYLVGMVNSNIELEVYREVATGLFDEEDVIFHRASFVLPGNGDSMGYTMLVDRHPDGKPSTQILMDVRVDKPELNVSYKISSGAYDIHSPSVATKEYKIVSDMSMIRFTRLDSLVAAGDFVFKAVSFDSDTVLIRGYFDIPPFKHK